MSQVYGLHKSMSRCLSVTYFPLAFLHFVDIWFGQVLFPLIKPLLYSEGGPVVMVQVGSRGVLVQLGRRLVLVQVGSRLVLAQVGSRLVLVQVGDS